MIEDDPNCDETTAALLAAASATDTSAVDTTATAECDVPAAKKLSNSQRRAKRGGKRHLKTSPTQQETNGQQKV